MTPFPVRVGAHLERVSADLPPALRRLVRTLVSNPGKSLRSRFVEASAGPASPRRSAVVRAGAVVELVHLASLLHDDVIDRAVIRRDQPAAHTVAGPELAQLAGLSCFGIAAREAADLGETANTVFGQAVASLALGEMLDVERAFDVDFPLENYFELVERKTGALFGLACQLGGLCREIDVDQLAVLVRFGLGFGVAFQILDDMLDLADCDTGKPVGTDHLLGLFGAPTLCALRRDESGRLSALLLDPEFNGGDLPEVRRLVAENNGMAMAADLARTRYHRALAELDQITDPDVRAALREIAERVWRRSP